MGAAPLSSCTNVLEATFVHDEELASALASQFGPQLLVRVDAAPIREGPGVHPSPFRLTDELTLEGLETVRAWAPLSWRHERSSQKGNRPLTFPWPSGPRFSIPQVSMRARLEGTRQYVLLQVSAAPSEQTMERVVANLEDHKEAAYHAGNFNKYISQSPHAPGFGHDHPKVKVCASVGCRVLDSRMPQLAKKGAVVTITDYSAPEVEKFAFDGSEDFKELPQSFFHHAVWATGGSTMLMDLQGSESENGDVLLVDPCVLRSQPPGVSDIVAAAAGKAAQATSDSPSDEAFEAIHKHCPQLCKGFDPHRRGAKVRRMCGMPACGLGGGGGGAAR
eukprot:TRINITY_DN114069_c0_g1_i1.p1 TRINITY_DN114069_c0_g1~~TRINITY_DN114069_c0_g1_i1.p1  ORF type:complete len:334 (+),score=63.71 TRINITY_DN114069_c0_g1_i1:77-1078(+)